MSGRAAAGKKDKRNAGAAVAPAAATDVDQGPEAKRPKGKATKKEDAADGTSDEETTTPVEATELTQTQEKRPRGRPKGTVKKPKEASELSQEKRPRGRPMGTTKKPKETADDNSEEKRSPGRPKKAAPEKTGAKRGRGRPPKKAKVEESGGSEDEEEEEEEEED